MSNFDVLYYPSFEPPAKWLRSFLLFFDTVSTIIPEGAQYYESGEILKLKKALPDAIQKIAPKQEDIEIEKTNMERLEKAFKTIKSHTEAEFYQTGTIKITDAGVMQSGAYTLTHSQKLTDNVLSMLKEYGLTSNYAFKHQNSEYYVTNSNASSLILSLIADNLAAKYGIHTATDREVEYVLNSLNAMQYNALSDGSTQLMSAIVKCEVPYEVSTLPIEKYLEIRASYSGIREAFQYVINDIAEAYRLNKASDSEYLRRKINQIKREFNKEVESYKSSRFARAIDRWYPVGLGGLIGVLGLVPGAQAKSAAARFGLDVLKEYRSNSDILKNKKTMQRLIADMKTTVLRKATIDSLG